ncbi:MAG TPA: alpha/beta hydrolase, partial [Promineifilum sp.]|nr:alpha/beta hydrolase [Promineifilum sp.]
MSRRTSVGTILFALLFVLFVSAPQILGAQSGDDEQRGVIDERPPEPLSRSAQGVNHYGNGPNNLPTPSDALFMVDSGSTMDQYLFRDQGPIEFGIEVDRVVGRTNSEGYLLDPQGLIDKGIISSKVQLQLSVYDVDEDYSGSEFNPEFDRVYVNGQYVGKLSGANNTWSVTRLEVDVRHVKFAVPSCNEFNGSSGPDYLSVCDSAPTPRINDIRIDIDTTNNDLIWAVEVDWAAMSFEAARPILFVHGKGDSNDAEDACSVPNGGFGCESFDKVDNQYYFGFRKQLNQAGFLTGIVENYLGGEVSIAENARRLSGIIDRFKKRYGVDKINLVGHSKGGLDSRGYISNHKLNDDNDVAVLITLASPHHGSYLADLGSKLPELALGFIGYSNTPALRNVSEKYMDDTFNPSHPAREGVRYYSVFAEAGEDCFWGSCAVDWQAQALPKFTERIAARIVYQLLYRWGSYKGENDFMVTVRSAQWDDIGGHTNANSFEYGPYDLNHHSIRAAMQQAGELDTTITNLVRDILDVKPNTVARAYRQDEPGVSEAEDSGNNSALGVESGSILEGQTI